jgi:hypothetical protein
MANLHGHEAGNGGYRQLVVHAPMNGPGAVLRRERLGGMLNFYYRDAA